MKCPHCPEVTLLMSERQGVEVDYCPECRGVWLDRGELDKLISLSVVSARPTPPGRQPDFVDSDDHHARRGYPRRQKSWLSDIFD